MNAKKSCIIILRGWSKLKKLYSESELDGVLKLQARIGVLRSLFPLYYKTY